MWNFILSLPICLIIELTALEWGPRGVSSPHRFEWAVPWYLALLALGYHSTFLFVFLIEGIIIVTSWTTNRRL
jgi:hypothetical protein